LTTITTGNSLNHWKRFCATGIAYTGSEGRIEIDKEGNDEREEEFLDFVYQPFIDSDDNVTGVFSPPTWLPHR
jgi:hypothetical protein